MPKLPIVKPKKLIQVLNKMGFTHIRQKGSHAIFLRKKDGVLTIVPIHSKDIGRGLLRKILNEIDLSVDEFIKLLH